VVGGVGVGGGDGTAGDGLSIVHTYMLKTIGNPLDATI
jgi:hypothetical protein